MTWDGIGVAAIVAACVVYLVRRWYRMLAGKSTGCGCGDCPAGKSNSHSAFDPAPKMGDQK